MNRVLVAAGRGQLAGLVGAAVMTVSQQVEMAVSKRPPSIVPGQVGVRLLGRSDEDAQRLSPVVHWGHGAAMGAVRGVLGAGGLRGPAASAVLFGMLWSGDAMLYKGLGIADWPWRWSRTALITDLGHKAVYAVSTGLVYDALSSRPAPSTPTRSDDIGTGRRTTEPVDTDHDPSPTE